MCKAVAKLVTLSLGALAAHSCDKLPSNKELAMAFAETIIMLKPDYSADIAAGIGNIPGVEPMAVRASRKTGP